MAGPTSSSRLPSTGSRTCTSASDGPAGPLRWLLVYHEFKAATGRSRYGSELDFQLTYRSPWNQTFGFRGALYDAEEFAVDTDKINAGNASDVRANLEFMNTRLSANLFSYRQPTVAELVLENQ